MFVALGFESTEVVGEWDLVLEAFLDTANFLALRRALALLLFFERVLPIVKLECACMRNKIAGMMCLKIINLNWYRCGGGGVYLELEILAKNASC